MSYLKCLKCGAVKEDSNFQIEDISQTEVTATFECENCKGINYVGFHISHVYTFIEKEKL
jgi:hypothetical protein